MMIQETLTTKSITTATEESYHLTDNDVIYRIEDYKDVQTIYLTGYM